MSEIQEHDAEQILKFTSQELNILYCAVNTNDRKVAQQNLDNIAYYLGNNTAREMFGHIMNAQTGRMIHSIEEVAREDGFV